MGERSDENERHKFHPDTINKSTNKNAADVDLEYIKNVEQDFGDIAENVLDNINLSHLVTRRKIKIQEK